MSADPWAETPEEVKEEVRILKHCLGEAYRQIQGLFDELERANLEILQLRRKEIKRPSLTEASELTKTDYLTYNPDERLMP
jgi:hypothetical protein